jgi:hypothetical protein
MSNLQETIAMLEEDDFGSSESVLRDIQERSDDIEKAVIPQSSVITVYDPNNHLDAEEVEAGMFRHMVEGNLKIVHPKDAELILNDGILNRMKIKIELGR